MSSINRNKNITFFNMLSCHTLLNKFDFLDSASYTMDGIVSLNDHLMYYELILTVIVLYMLVSVLFNNKLVIKDLTHGSVLEIVWTLIPGIVLILIALPSFRLLFLMSDMFEPSLTIKVIGLLIDILFIIIGLKLCKLNKIKDTCQNFEVKKIAKLYKFNLGPHHIIKTNFHTNARAINRIGPHNQDVISVLIGLLLGDGHMNRITGEGVKLRCRQSIIHKNYIFWLHKFFYSRGYTKSQQPSEYSTKLKNTDKTYYGFEFNTLTFRSFNWIYKLFYDDGKKRISPLLMEYLTPLALAVWIMDNPRVRALSSKDHLASVSFSQLCNIEKATPVGCDGGRTGYGLRIATNSFDLKCVKLLRNILVEKYDLDVTIQHIYIKDKYSLYIKSNSMKKLRELVFDHIHPSMRYKLG
jgi:heme/copper-type cytochrome/quinol oxidase subunit 2